MNIKEKLKSIPKLVKKVLEKFPITILAILLFTVFLAIAVDNKIIGEKILENIMFFTLYFVPGSFLIETLLNKNNEKKIFSYVIVTIVSIVLTVFQNKGICENILWKISVCYVVTLLNLSIYF